jgi:hypothetical protein
LKNSEDIFCAFTTEQQKLYGSFGKAKHWKKKFWKKDYYQFYPNNQNLPRNFALFDVWNLLHKFEVP